MSHGRAGSSPAFGTIFIESRNLKRVTAFFLYLEFELSTYCQLMVSFIVNDMFDDRLESWAQIFNRY